MPIGAHVTLRGDRMWEFLDRLLSLALPRIRDFRGLSPKQFDGNGNYTFGLNEQSMFHEIDQDRIDRVRGMDITVVTTATHRRRGPRAAAAPRLPVQGDLTVAKKALVNKANAQAQVQACAATPAASAAAGRTRSTASSACAGSASGRWRTRGELPGITKSSLVSAPDLLEHRSERRRSVPRDGQRGNHGERRPGTAMTMTDPIADMLTRLRNANSAYHDTVRCRTRRSRRTSPRSSSRRATSPAGASRTPRSARPS